MHKCNRLSPCDFPACDLVTCDLPEVPRCEDGQAAVLKNPGECQPIHECGMPLTDSLWCSSTQTWNRARIYVIFHVFLFISTPLLARSLQKRRVCSWTSRRLCRTSSTVGEKNKVLRRVWMCMQLPELYPHLPCGVHRILLYQRLRLHRHHLPARQGVWRVVFWLKCLCFHLCVFPDVLFRHLCVCPGVCGWWRGSPSGEWMGGGVSEVQMHPVAGQRYVTAHCSVHATRVWS